jgi:hypothetical protein
VLKVLAAAVDGAGLEGGIMRLWVSVLVVFGGWWVDRVVAWRNTAEDTDPMVGVGLSRIRAEREEGAL